MKRINVLILSLFSLVSYAQNTATITLTAPKSFQATATLILEDVHFSPNLGTGLADTKLETVASVNFMETTSEKTTIKISEPKMMRLQYGGGGVNKT